MKMKFLAAAAAIGMISVSTSALAQTYAENFDAVAAPALPTGWTTSGTGAGTPWTTGTIANTAPNALRQDPAFSTGSWEVTSPLLTSSGSPASMTFQLRFSYEACCDGLQMQISRNGAPYEDALVAGGTFTLGG